MSLIVIDASAALSWILPAQSTVAANEFLRDHNQDTFVAPDVFAWEAGNILLARERRRLFGGDDFDLAAAALDFLPITLIDSIPRASVAHRSLARTGDISLFDAAYLQLAIDFDCALATRDGGLIRVARTAGIDCFDLRGVPAP